MTNHATNLTIMAGLALSALAPAAFAQDTDAKDCAVSEYTMGLRYQQQSAEVRALQLQAYNFAKLRLDAIVKDAEDPSKLAIATDLDETAIDNTALLARDLANCHTYEVWDTWLPWERDGKPTLIPGALEFFNYADSLGVKVFYISDCAEEQQAYTVDLLNELGFPQVSDETVMLLGPTKVDRRAKITADHKLIMLLGDTLADFDGRFKKTPLEEQKVTVDEESDKWGAEWIVLPNASYGSWADAPLTAWDAEIVIEEW